MYYVIAIIMVCKDIHGLQITKSYIPVETKVGSLLTLYTNCDGNQARVFALAVLANTENLRLGLHFAAYLVYANIIILRYIPLFLSYLSEGRLIIKRIYC